MVELGRILERTDLGGLSRCPCTGPAGSQAECRWGHSGNLGSCHLTDPPNNSISECWGYSPRHGSDIRCHYRHTVHCYGQTNRLCIYIKRNTSDTKCAVATHFKSYDADCILKYYLVGQGSPLVQTCLVQDILLSPSPYYPSINHISWTESRLHNAACVCIHVCTCMALYYVTLENSNLSSTMKCI